MKINLLILLLISIIKIKSGEKDNENENYDDNPENTNYEEYNTNSNNINIVSISYELVYDEYSLIRVIIKALELIDYDISFNAYLISEEDKQKYILNCSFSYYDTIVCLSEKNITLNTEHKYYFYYEKGENGKYLFNEKETLEDDKRISLIFKPEVEENQKMYKDSRKIMVKTDKKMINGGYLYIVRKSKKILHYPKDGFNKYIEMNNFIPHAGLLGYRPQSTLIAFEEAIRRGYHIVDADLIFTGDNIPVICHGNNLKGVSNGNGEISSKSLEELLKLDFGSIFNPKYKGEKILTFEKLLKLCKAHEIIIDLDLCHLNETKYFNETDDYAKIIIDLVEKYDMFNSIFFNDYRPQVILKLKQFRKDISISLLGMNKIENIEKIKDQYKDSKRIIYNMGGLSHGNNISEDAVKYGLSLGKKIKAAKVDDIDFAKKIQSWGVNFITTNYLHPFLINNENEYPFAIRCIPHDHDEEESSECELEYDLKLIDNEKYSIYYTDNIYNIFEDIKEEPIGEFQYIDTYLLDELYYSILNFDFEKGIIQLNTSNVIKKGESVMGVVGPDYDNVEECYQYNFICNGDNSHTINCKILKDEEDKVEFKGNYKIYSLEDYSLSSEEVLARMYKNSKKRYVFYSLVIIFVLIVIIMMIYLIKFKNNEKFNEIKIAGNSYLGDNNLFK